MMGLFSVKAAHWYFSDRKNGSDYYSSLNHDFQSAVKLNRMMIDWIEKRYKQALKLRVSARCISSGKYRLVDGRKVSTHWSAAIICGDVSACTCAAGQINHGRKWNLTNGGAYSFLN